MRAFWAYIRVDQELTTQDQIREICRQLEEVEHVTEVRANAPTAEN